MDESEPPQPVPFPNGGRRVVINGTSGSGKTTLARQLSQLLDIPHVELDAFRHGPNWTETPDDIFRERVSGALQGDCWVVDGNYSVLRDVVWPKATTVIWLDYPFPLVFWRLFWRTMRRSAKQEVLWNGNRESLWTQFFTKDSLFLWVLKTHWRRRKSLPLTFALPQYSHLRVIHHYSPRQTRKWLDEIARVDL
jgi:adenylate kinase family enzyme